MAKREIKKPKKKHSGKISENVTDLKAVSYDEQYARLAFSKTCDRYCLLSEWHDDELTDLVKCFQKMENMLWKDILIDPGFDYEMIKNIAFPRPKTLPPDTKLRSLRVCQKKRLYGYRTQDTFFIIWFDRQHAVCPMDKARKYMV